VWSTFLGGSGRDNLAGIDLRPNGDAFITGSTTSADFPTTANAFDATFNGATDTFVVTFDRTGSAGYSTFLGGSASDGGADIAATRQGHAVVTGSTGSPDFPITPSAFDPTFNGGTDAFVTKLAATRP
jgi:hypothetical protein